jgi:hypothetical protein
MIRFQDGEPQGIFYSQHRDGTAYQWDDEAVSKQDGRVSRMLLHLFTFQLSLSYSYS